MLFLWHSSSLFWKKISCDQQILDKASVFCAASNTKEENHLNSANMSSTIHSQEAIFSINHVFFCQNGSIILSWRICNHVSDCFLNDDETICSLNILNRSIVNLVSQSFVPNISKSTIVNDTHKMAKKIPRQKAVSEEKENCEKCFYNILDRKRDRFLVQCKNGFHLDNCKHFPYQTTFKCLGYYCVPWRYVCDGYWDCPLGYDEDICITTSRLGFFHCANSLIQILNFSICDNIIDCPENDDEEFCDLSKAVCPSSCFCILYSFLCRRLDGQVIKATMPHKYIFLHFNQALSLVQLGLTLSMFVRVEFLNVSLNSLLHICSPKGILNQAFLQILIASDNNITQLVGECFGVFPKIKYVDVKANKIFVISCDTFHKTEDIEKLILAENKLIYLESCFFSSLLKLRLLDLMNNPIAFVPADIFDHMMENSIVVLSSLNVFCCFRQTVKCGAKESQPCISMLKPPFVTFVLMSIGLFGISLNAISLLYNVQQLKYHPKPSLPNQNTKKSYNIFALSISASYLLFCIMILAVASASIHFGDSFATNTFEWRKSILCSFISFLFIFYSVASTIYMTILAVSRYSVVHFPLESKFKQTSFSAKISGHTLSAVIIYSIVSSTLNFTLNDHELDTILCLPVNHTIVSTATISLLVFVETILAFVLIFLYYKIVQKVSAQALNIESKSPSKQTSTAMKAALACMINFVCWIPTSSIFVYILIAETYPQELLVGALSVAMPINPLFYPILLNVKFQCLCRKCKKHE